MCKNYSVQNPILDLWQFTKKPEDSAPPTSQWKRFKIIDWTFYVMIVGGVVAVTAGIAAVIFSMIPLGVGAGVSLICFAIGAWSIYRFSSLQALDDIATLVKQNIQEIKEENVKNKELVEQSEKNLTKFKKEVKDFKELSDKNLTTLIEDKKQALARLFQVNVLKKQVETSKEIIQKLKIEVESMTKQISIFIEKLALLPKHRDDLNHERMSLEKKIKDIESQHKGLEKKVEPLEKHALEMEKNNAEITENLKSLKAFIKLFEEMHVSTLEMSNKMNAEIKNMKELNKHYFENESKREAAQKDLNKLIDKKTIVDQLNPLTEMLKTLNQAIANANQPH